jgi:hypothetical protein
MGKRVHWLTGSEVTFLDCALQHCPDGSQAVKALQFTPFAPAQHGRFVDEKYPLNVRGEGRIEKADESLPQLV